MVVLELARIWGLVDFGHEARDYAKAVDEGVGFRALNATHGEAVEDLGDGNEHGTFVFERGKFEGLVFTGVAAGDLLVRRVMETEVGAADRG